MAGDDPATVMAEAGGPARFVFVRVDNEWRWELWDECGLLAVSGWWPWRWMAALNARWFRWRAPRAPIG